MPTRISRYFSCTLVLLFAAAAQSQDLHIKKNITIGGNVISSQETSIHGARERTVNQTPAGNTVTIRQCDLKRTLTLNEQTQTYHIANDAKEDANAKAAAMFGAPAANNQTGGTITETASITDTGEHKTISGYTARHLKMKVSIQPSANACSQQAQEFDVDGWYADLSKESSACQQYLPPVQQAEGCNDRVIHKHSGTGRPGYPLEQTVVLHNADGSTTEVGITSEITKQDVNASLYDVPAGFREVSSLAELNGVPNVQVAQVAQAAPQVPVAQPVQQPAAQPPAKKKFGLGSIMNPAAMVMNPAAQIASMQSATAIAQQAMAANAGKMGATNALAASQNMMGQAAMAQAMGQASLAQASMAQAAMSQAAMSQAAMGQAGMGQAMMGQGLMGQGLMPQGAQQTVAGAPVAAPQVLGPKAPGKLRIGVAPPDAQLGQGSQAGADYSTPIRNVEIALMSGPAIEIAALESHVAMQLQAEAQQKQCDFILMSGVTVKHSTGGGFGKFMKIGSTAANFTPVGMMTKGVGGMVAAQAGAAASQIAAQQMQQQAISQLAGFNGQIKSKDDVTIQYQLFATGTGAQVLQNSLQGKAKSDGEDVLTPLLQQTANAVLTQVSQHK